MCASQTDILAKKVQFLIAPLLEKWFSPRIYAPLNFLKNLILASCDTYMNLGVLISN